MSINVRALQRFLTDSAGLAFEGEQYYLAESRLQPLAERHGISTVDALIGELASGLNPLLAHEALEAMLTHETLFFRDRTPFEQFKTQMLPRLLIERADTRRIRIWCAACSTGQEPYSLAMLLDEEGRKLAGWNIEILATDLSQTAISIARAGRYSQFEVQRGMPITSLLRYFQRGGDAWQLSEHIRARVDFRQHNLINDFGRLGAFDIIFCRNVLIYFDASTRQNVVSRLRAALNIGGYLVVGASESAIGLAPDLRPLPFQTAIAQKSQTVPGTMGARSDRRTLPLV